MNHPTDPGNNPTVAHEHDRLPPRKRDRRAHPGRNTIPHRAVGRSDETLMLAERNYLDQVSAERLLLLSFYPIGSAVELNDGAVGLVVATPNGSTYPDRPVVHLATDAKGQPFAWPCVIDLVEKRDRSIARCLSADERQALLGLPLACV